MGLIGFIIGAVVLYVIIRMAVGDTLRAHHRWLVKRGYIGTLHPGLRTNPQDRSD